MKKQRVVSEGILKSAIREFERKSAARLAQGIHHFLDPEAGYDEADFSVSSNEIIRIMSGFESIHDELDFPLEAARFLRMQGNTIQMNLQEIEKRKRLFRKKEQLRMIREVADGLTPESVDFQYLSELAKALGLSAVRTIDKSFFSLLEKLPEAIAWDFSFDATVTTDLCPEGIPVIKTYKALIGTLEFSCPTLTSCIVKPPSEAALSPFTNLRDIDKTLLLSEPDIAAQNKYVREVFAVAVRDIAGLADYSFRWHYPQKENGYVVTNPLQGSYVALEFGAISFLELHELSHILLGHVKQERTLEIEYEADCLAMEILCRSRNSIKFLSMMIAGAYFLLELFCAKMKIEGQADRIIEITQERIQRMNSIVLQIVGPYNYGNLLPERDATFLVLDETLRSQDFLDWAGAFDLNDVNTKEIWTRVATQGRSGQFNTQVDAELPES